MKQKEKKNILRNDKLSLDIAEHCFQGRGSTYTKVFIYTGNLALFQNLRGVCSKPNARHFMWFFLLQLRASPLPEIDFSSSENTNHD